MLQNFTEKEYFKDTYLYSSTGTLMHARKDDKGIALIFNSTIFHPQGGGQPSDVGTIESLDKTIKFDVKSVSIVDDLILHHVQENSEINLESLESVTGSVFNFKIDSEKRILFSKSHTAGHLLGSIVLKLYPELKAKKSYHFLDGPNIVFIGDNLSEICKEKVNFIENVEKNIKNIIEMGAEISTDLKNGTRLIEMKGFHTLPCGGTHLRNVNELKEVKIRKVNISNGDLKVCYTFL
jgi:Ser-tRNA(Ala) deacylase AlaX